MAATMPAARMPVPPRTAVARRLPRGARAAPPRARPGPRRSWWRWRSPSRGAARAVESRSLRLVLDVPLEIVLQIACAGLAALGLGFGIFARVPLDVALRLP